MDTNPYRMTLDKLLSTTNDDGVNVIGLVAIAQYVNPENEHDTDLINKARHIASRLRLSPIAHSNGIEQYDRSTAALLVAELVADKWYDARQAERDAAADAKDCMRELAAINVPITRIANIMRVNRITADKVIKSS